jgi:GrpB-like predicted nucleotidyltransferase (UPF0157 family)
MVGHPWDADVQAFYKLSTDRHLYDLHLVPLESARYSEMLAFRDFLRANRQVALGYAGLKRDLASRHADDRHGYSAAKVDLIQTVLAQL